MPNKKTDEGEIVQDPAENEVTVPREDVKQDKIDEVTAMEEADKKVADEGYNPDPDAQPVPPVPTHDTNQRVEPGDLNYKQMYHSYFTSGEPGEFTYLGIRWMSLKDNDIIAFIKKSNQDAIGSGGAYASISIKK